MTPSSSPSAQSSSEAPKTSLWHKIFFGPGGAATLAGSCEIVIFHPFDTCAKRLMSYRHRVVDPTSLSSTLANANHVIFGQLDARFKDHPEMITMWERVKHMYPGSLYAVAYKVLQRALKFGGQPYMRDYLHTHHSNVFFYKDPQTGAFVRTGRGAPVLEATAGALVGVCEIVLLPFDRMKVLNQINKAEVADMGLFGVIRKKGIQTLYSGAATTAIRNALGSFLLFGGTAFTKEYVFKLENYKDATFLQNIAASTVGGCVGVFFTSPLDVIKTRIQSQRLADNQSGLQIFTQTVRTEGFSAFYKGITPKIITSAPRLVFSYTMTQYFLKFLQGNSKKTTKTA